MVEDEDDGESDDDENSRRTKLRSTPPTIIAEHLAIVKEDLTWICHTEVVVVVVGAVGNNVLTLVLLARQVRIREIDIILLALFGDLIKSLQFRDRNDGL